MKNIEFATLRRTKKTMGFVNRVNVIGKNRNHATILADDLFLVGLVDRILWLRKLEHMRCCVFELIQ